MNRKVDVALMESKGWYSPFGKWWKENQDELLKCAAYRTVAEKAWKACEDWEVERMRIIRTHSGGCSDVNALNPSDGTICHCNKWRDKIETGFGLAEVKKEGALWLEYQ